MSRETYLIKLKRDIYWLTAKILKIHWMSDRFKPKASEWLDNEQFNKQVLQYFPRAKYDERTMSGPEILLLARAPIQVYLVTEHGMGYPESPKLAISDGTFMGRMFELEFRMNPDIIGFFKNHYLALDGEENEIVRIAGLGAVTTFSKYNEPYYLQCWVLNVQRVSRGEPDDAYTFQGELTSYGVIEERIGFGHGYYLVSFDNRAKVEEVLGRTLRP